MKFDEINSPSHYAGGGRRFEVIDVLEDWAGRASDPVEACLLFSCLKYLGRLYDKGSAEINAKKSLWYLQRLIEKLEAGQNKPVSPPVVSFVTYDDVISASELVKNEFCITTDLI